MKKIISLVIFLLITLMSLAPVMALEENVNSLLNLFKIWPWILIFVAFIGILFLIFFFKYIIKGLIFLFLVGGTWVFKKFGFISENTWNLLVLGLVALIAIFIIYSFIKIKKAVSEPENESEK